jgi:hypothetical protein
LPIYEAAKQRIAVLQSAIAFMRAVIRVDASLAGLSRGQPNHRKALASVRRGVGDLTEKGGDALPITPCKLLPQLRGMIGQAAPPKIMPYAAQSEAWASLVKDEQPSGYTVRRRGSQKRWSSMSIAGLAAAKVQPLAVLSQATADFGAMELAPLPFAKVQRVLLDISQIQKAHRSFVLSPAEFVALNES